MRAPSNAPWRWLPTSAVHLFLVGAVVLALAPFIIMLFGGFKNAAELAINPGGPPSQPTTENYLDLFSGDTGALMWRSLANTLLVTVPFTAITVLLCALAGYAFAKMAFPGSRIIFAVLIASMLVPSEVNIPSLYIFFSQIDWLNTYIVQIIPGTASVLGMFMVRQFMAALPTEVLEAARVDGAGQWRTFWQVVLPMSIPVLSAVAVLTFVAKWSDYLWPAIMVNDAELQPVMVILPQLSTGANGLIVHYEILLAGATIITLPLLIIFARFQDKLMSGTVAGAVRG